MDLLAAAIFAIAIIYFAIHHPRFRKSLRKGLLIILAIIVGLSVVAGGYAYWESQDAAKREVYAKTLIRQADVDFYELTLASSYGMYTVRGNVRNRSKYPLKSFKLKVTVQDCPAGKCDTMAKMTSGSMASISRRVRSGRSTNMSAYPTCPIRRRNSGTIDHRT